MRVTWLVAWASLAALIGCANNNQPTGPGTYSIGQYGGAPAAPAAAGSYGSAVAQADAGAVRPASWTQRVASVFKQNPMKTLGLDKDVASAARPTPADSISLNYRSADPSPELLVSMGAVSDQAGSTDQARQLYQRALTAQPGHAGALMALARLEDRHGNLPAALQRYQEAATQNPENATVLNDLALCHARMGDLPQSLLLLHQATKIDPDRALYRNNIAKVLVEMNRVEDALAELSVVHSPGHAHYNIGVLLNERGRQAEAAHFAQSALLFDPQLTQAQ
ncbi:MAG: tetratricopeptide repeat protein, partial [Planctomycetota bacterium]